MWNNDICGELLKPTPFKVSPGAKYSHFTHNKNNNNQVPYYTEQNFKKYVIFLENTEIFLNFRKISDKFDNFFKFFKNFYAFFFSS